LKRFAKRRLGVALLNAGRSDEHDHFATGLTSLHHSVSFANVVEPKTFAGKAEGDYASDTVCWQLLHKL